MLERLKNINYKNGLIKSGLLVFAFAVGNSYVNMYETQGVIVKVMNTEGKSTLAEEMFKDKIADKQLTIFQGPFSLGKRMYYSSEIGEQGLQKKRDEAKDLGLQCKVEFVLRDRTKN